MFIQQPIGEMAHHTSGICTLTTSSAHMRMRWGTTHTNQTTKNLKVVKPNHSTSIKMKARPLIAISQECGTPWDTSVPNGTTKKKEDASRMSVTSWVIKTRTAICQSATVSLCSKQHITRSNRSKGSLELKKPSHQYARSVPSIYCD